MGRAQPTVILRPQAKRRSDRAKQAKDTVNRTIPDLLKSSPRARHGIHNARLIVDPPTLAPEIKASGTSTPKKQPIAAPTIRIRYTDTLTAARHLTSSSRRASATSRDTTSKPRNVCLLSMASPLRPGGGFLDGATSQEEFLCMRTTLYPSLWDEFYRLPEVGGILTPDVLVHRDSTPDADELPKRERFFVDVISSAMLRFPETNNVRRPADGEEGAEGACTCGVSYCDRDRELVTRKMRAVMRMAQQQGAEKLVLGAWGCGAYGNPVKEVAKIWKRVLLGTPRRKEDWAGVKEVVFAINDRTMLREFEKCFADVMTREMPTSPPQEPEGGKTVSTGSSPVIGGAKTPTTELVNELVSKIQETELQLDQISNPRSKARLRDVIANLNRQLAQVGAEQDLLEDEMPPDPEDEDAAAAVDNGVPASDGEGNSYYNFDSSDVASSGSVSPSSSDMYEFKVPQAQGQASENMNSVAYPISSMHGAIDTTDRDMSTMNTSCSSSYEYLNTFNMGDLDDDHMDNSSGGIVGSYGRTASNQLDYESGWFSGSINGLSALLSNKRRAPGSPVLRPDSSGIDVQDIGMGLGEYLRRYSQVDDD